MSRVVRMLDCEPGQKPKVEVAGFVIENDVPLPVGRGKENRVWQAMNALEVGQSFLIPGCDAKTNQALSVAPRFPDRVFRTKKMTTGVRVWRVK